MVNYIVLLLQYNVNIYLCTNERVNKVVSA